MTTIIDVFPLDKDIDAEAERLAAQLGERFVKGAMVAQYVRLEFSPIADEYIVTAVPNLRVRDGPSVLTGKILGNLPTGARVSAVSEAGDWLQHDSDVGRGWSVKRWLEKIKKPSL